MLTTQQLATLKTAVNANGANYSNPSAVEQRDGNNIAVYFNGLASPVVLVWNPLASVQDVYDAIDWTKYTPTDVPSTSDTASVGAAYTNRLLMIQTKQMNLQNMLVGRSTINAAKLNVRTGLRDAVISIPSGANGAAISAAGAGGATAMTALTRSATRGEALFVSNQTTLGGVTASIMGFEGALSGVDILAALDNGYNL